jgi:hypothetical protein
MQQHVSSFYARNHSYFDSMFLLTDGSEPRISRPTARLYVRLSFLLRNACNSHSHQPSRRLVKFISSMPLHYMLLLVRLPFFSIPLETEFQPIPLIALAAVSCLRSFRRWDTRTSWCDCDSNATHLHSVHSGGRSS